jgi:3-methyladenine DNA glycosylase AlkC
MPPFKDELSPALVDALADELARAWGPFPQADFAARATRGLEGLELKARAAHIADALVAALPGDARGLERLVRAALRSPGFDGWMIWPFLDAVGAIGIGRPRATLPLLRALTPRWSAEFAIRPFLARHADVTFAHLDAWVDDPDEHVRRLVSEGSRPRLPWATRIPALVADPGLTIPLLDRLRDDPSEYVRRSVANHLNDIAKDHPGRAVAVAARWRDEGGEHVDRVVRHAMRALVKRGDPAALAVVGVDSEADVRVVSFAAEPAVVAIGADTELRCVIRAREDARVEVDLRVHYPDRTGALTRKATFKLARRSLAAGEEAAVTRRFAFRPVSIRAIHPGAHRLEIQVNGRILARCEVDVR